MPEQSVIHSSFAIERSFPATPDRVFAAFSDPARKRRWFGDDRGMSIERFEMDFRVGGRDHSSYRMGDNTPFPGTLLTNDTIYQDIVPGRRIVIAYTMTLGGKRISASLATFEFLPGDAGTDLVFTEQSAFFEGADGPQMREAGWRNLLGLLAGEVARSAVHA